MICKYCNTEHPEDQIANPHWCIARMGETIEGKDAVIAGLNEQAECCNCHIGLDKQIADLHAAIKSWMKVVDDRDEQIVSWSKIVDTMKKKMHEKDKAWVDLWESKEEVNRAWFDLGKKLIMANLQITTQQAEIDRLKALCFDLAGPDARKEAE